MNITRDEARQALGGLDTICGLLGIRVEKGGKAKTIYTPGEVQGMELSLAQALNRKAVAINKPLQEDILRMLSEKDWTALAAPERETIYRLVSERLTEAGTEMAEAASPIIHNEAERVYSEVREILAGELGISADFDAIDQKLIGSFSRDNNYWIGKHYSDDHLEAVKRLGARAIEEGVGRDELADRFRAALGDQFEDYHYWDVLSSSVINRSRTYSAIEGMHTAGIKEYEWFAQEDERMCEICGELNGQRFSVEAAHQRIEEVADLETPEDLKTETPWVGIETEEGKPVGFYFKDDAGDRVPVDLHDPGQLQASGMGFPPIHGNSYDKITEIRTMDGWKLVSEVKIGDNCLSLNPKDFSLEYVPVIKTYEHFAAEMIHFQSKNGDLDLMVTPDHNVFYQSVKCVEWGFVKARELLGEQSGRMFRGLNGTAIVWKDYTYRRAMEVSEIEYNDTAYCVDLAKFHTLLTRRNGKVVWSGNCRCDMVIAD